MSIIKRIKALSKIQLLAIGLILIGLLISVRYGMRTLDAYRELRFAQENNFDAGNPDIDVIRPWMNIEYIAVAYTVPQEFIFNQLGIPMERRNSKTSLQDLNELFNFGKPAEGGRRYEPIISAVQEAIKNYRENPVSTGLQERGVQPWMSVQYIANSTGIPAEEIFTAIGLPMAGNTYIPLERLADETKYEGSMEQLAETIQQLVERREQTGDTE